MAREKISKRTVDALSFDPAGPAQQFLWDESLGGFGCYVLASGRKVYVAQYRLNGRQQRVKIGVHGPVTPEQARAEAKRILGSVAHGADPAAERRERRAARTVNEVADQWLAEHVAVYRKPRTHSEYSRVVDTYLRPRIGRTPIGQVRAADMSSIASSMRAAPVQANRVLAIFGSLWSFAAKAGDVDAGANPVRGLARFREQGRERFLSSDELARLGAALTDGETIGLPYDIDERKPGAKHSPRPENRRVKIDVFAAGAIRLLLLTGARVSEILGAQWSQVDLERGVIFLADSKAGKRPLYLSGAAIEVLTSIPRVQGNPFIVVGGKKGAPRADIKRPWAAVRRAADLGGLRLHDLRHSFASIGAGASLGLPIVGKLLGHSQAATTAKYAHLADSPLRHGADVIGERIAAALASDSQSPAKPAPHDRKSDKNEKG